MINKNEIELLLSLLPDWVIYVPRGLDATFYGTGTYEGDIEIKNKIDEIKKKLKNG